MHVVKDSAALDRTVRGGSAPVLVASRQGVAQVIDPMLLNRSGIRAFRKPPATQPRIARKRA